MQFAFKRAKLMMLPSSQNVVTPAFVSRRSRTNPKRLAITLGLFVIAVMLILFAGCGNSREAARQALDQKGVSFTGESFFEHIKQGDAETVKLFLVAGINVNAKDETGSTGLHLATLRGDDPMVELLLRYKADVNAETNIGETPLMIAALRGYPETVKLLLATGADVNAKDNRGETPLMHAMERDHSDVIEILKAAGGKE